MAATNKTHAKYGPSTLKSLKHCAGYLSDSGSSDASIQGDRCHMLCECELDEKKAAIKWAKEDKDHPGIPWSLSEEERMWAHAAYEYVQGLIEPGDKVEYEISLDLSAMGIAGLDKGTADVLITPKKDPKRRKMVDYKFGWGEIDEVEKNHQFRTYGCGVLYREKKAEVVELHMVQPKLNMVDSCDFQRSEVELVESTNKAIIRRVELYRKDPANNENLLDASDETTCGYCSRQATCPLWTKTAIKVAEAVSHLLDDSKFKIPYSIIPKKFSGFDADSADPLEVAQMYAILDGLKGFIEKFKPFALSMHLEGRELPGYTTQDGSTKTEVIAPLDVLDIVEKETTVSRDEAIGTFDVNLGELVKLIRSKSAKGMMEKDEKALRDLLSSEGLLIPGHKYTFLKRMKIAKE